MTDSAIITKSDHYHLLNIFSKSDSRGGSGSPPGSRECSQGCCRTGSYDDQNQDGLIMTLLRIMIITLLKSLIMTLLTILFFQAPQAFSHDAALAAHAEAERQVFDLFHPNTKYIFCSIFQLFSPQNSHFRLLPWPFSIQPTLEWLAIPAR